MMGHKKWKFLILLFIVLFIAYLPLSSFYFGMKNDAFSDNFPDKFFLSEAIHSGMNPLWNPYMNFGFPVYADMGFAFWNPITWIFAGIGYNAYTLTCEVLLYLFIAGICMFYLGTYLKFSNKTSFAIACMYMCSGFFTGSLQYINFITSAAFLPAALLALLRVIEHPSIKNSFFLALAGYMIMAGGHPAIPIGFAYFTVIFTGIFLLTNIKDSYKIRSILLYGFIAFILLLVFYLPAIYSYINILPFYGRNHPVPAAKMVNTGLSVSSLVSFLLPFFTALQKNIFSADVAMRNVYISISGFMLMILSIRHKSKYTFSLIAGSVVSLIMATRGQFKTDLLSRLPLLSYIQTNGQFRVFTILCLCVLAGYSIDKLISQDNKIVQPYKGFLKAVLLVCLLIILITLTFYFKQTASEISGIGNTATFIGKIKSFLNGSAQLFLLISTTITFMVAFLSYTAIQKKKFHLIIPLVVIDLIINSILYLPVTGVGQTTIKDIKAVYDSYPKGIPVPALTSINDMDTTGAGKSVLTGNPGYYNKKIGTPYLTDYPSYFLTTEAYFNDPIKEDISKKAYLFTKSSLYNNDNPGAIVVQKFSPCNTILSVQSGKEDSLVFLQNYYRYWKAFNNKKEVPVMKSCISFMSVAIHPGQNDIEFIYIDGWLPVMIAFSITCFVLCVILYFTKWRHRQHKYRSVLI